MKLNTPRIMRMAGPRGAAQALALALALALPSAHAQPPEPPEAGNVYDLFQGPANLGEFETTFTSTAGVDAAATDLSGTSRSHIAIPGLLDFVANLTVAADGSARDYLLSGTVQGVSVDMRVAFSVAGASITATQAGQTNSFELASTEPLYVIDNNFIDGMQVVARRAAANPDVEVDVAIIVPQVAMSGRLVARASRDSETIEHGAASLATTRVETEMTVAGQTIASTIWLDDAGDIVILEQPVGAIRFVRRSAATDAATSEGATATAAGAQQFLESASQCVTVAEVSVASTGETLAGLLTLPVEVANGQAAPAPTLLLLPGSGAVDLAGNALPVIRNSGLEQLAYALGCLGYGTLRVAKLGIAPSTGDGNAVTLETYAQNTADWLALLAEQPGVDASSIGLLGHSEGGLVGLYAVAQGLVDPKVIVLVATPGRPFDVLLTEQLLARAEESGASADDLVALQAEVQQAIEAIRSSSGVRLELTEELADNSIAELFAHAAGLLRSEMAQDPAALIAGLDLPILIIQGEKDLQVRPVDGTTLAAAAPHAHLVTPTDLTHNLVDVAGPALTGLVPGPDAVISTSLLQALESFLSDELPVADR